MSPPPPPRAPNHDGAARHTQLSVRDVQQVRPHRHRTRSARKVSVDSRETTPWARCSLHQFRWYRSRGDWTRASACQGDADGTDTGWRTRGASGDG
eukprot:scaffold201055_cov29-Tisochrysis_lutea.AAC.17